MNQWFTTAYENGWLGGASVQHFQKRGMKLRRHLANRVPFAHLEDHLGPSAHARVRISFRQMV